MDKFFIEHVRKDIGELRSMKKPRATLDARADHLLSHYANFAMLEKLRFARAKGRGGWWDDKDCSIDHLRDLLKSHVEKGDMVDVMNLAAMIYVREIADAPEHKEV